MIEKSSRSLKERVNDIKAEYKFEYLYAIDLSSLENIISISGDKDKLYVSSSGIARGDTFSNGKIYCVNLKDKGHIEEIVSGINNRISLPICFVAKKNWIIYGEIDNQGGYLLGKYDIISRQKEVFYHSDKNIIQYAACIKEIDGFIFVSDIFKHSIKKFNLEGELQQELTDCNGFEFPRDIEKVDEENVIISFDNEISRKYRPDLSKGQPLLQTHFAKWNHVDNKFVPLNFSLDIIMHSIANTGGNYFLGMFDSVSCVPIVAKVNKNLEIIFYEKLSDIYAKSVGVKKPLIGTSQVNFIEDKLFIAEVVHGNSRKILVFDVGK